MKRRELPLPAFFFDSRESNVVKYFREANHTVDEGLSNAYGRVCPSIPFQGTATGTILFAARYGTALRKQFSP